MTLAIKSKKAVGITHIRDTENLQNDKIVQHQTKPTVWIKNKYKIKKNIEVRGKGNNKSWLGLSLGGSYLWGEKKVKNIGCLLFK